MEAGKKAAAAAIAVMHYIQTEEEALYMQSIQVPEVEKPAPPAVKLWGASGRQAQMQMRDLLQRRTFRR